MAWGSASWNADRQTLARAVYEAAKREARNAPTHHPVSVGNYLTRSFDRKYMPKPVGGLLSGAALRSSALTVRDAQGDGSRFSGKIPADTKRPEILPRRGGMYLSYNLRGQLAEGLHYASSGKHVPGNVQSTLVALQGRCLVLCRPKNDFELVTLQEFGNDVEHFYNAIQRDRDVSAAMKKLNYRDITQAIFAPDDYSAPRGFSLGLESDSAIDGLAIGSARNFETTGSQGNRFESGDNIVLYGPNMQTLDDRVKVVSVHTVDFDPPAMPGKWVVQSYKPNGAGDYEEVGVAPLT
jgi:hypothetical protein